MRTAAKVDRNQSVIVQGLRDTGHTVWVTSMIGHGGPDIVYARNSVTILAEIKDGSLPASKRKLTPAEKAFHKAWKGVIIVVNNLEDAIEAMNEEVRKRGW